MNDNHYKLKEIEEILDETKKCTEGEYLDVYDVDIKRVVTSSDDSSDTRKHVSITIEITGRAGLPWWERDDE